jgi:very-short-patch-repair endonuclease
MGLKFKRQKPFGPYIVDFICLERGVIVEVDGGQHGDDVAYDQRRDQWLASQGFVVLRFWNHDVLNQTESVLERIRLAVDEQSFSPLPSPPAPLP